MNWKITTKFSQVWLHFEGEKHHLIELREKEWNHSPDYKHIEGMRAFYEMANTRILLNDLKKIGINNPETRVKIILRIKKIATKMFGGKQCPTKYPKT